MFSFKREASIYFVFSDSKYKVDFSNVNLTQQFKEVAYSNKSLQEDNLFEQASLFEAAPASWGLTFPLIAESDFKVLFDRVLDGQSFDLYIETTEEIFKVSKSVITNAIFIIVRDRVLQLELSGQGSRITKELSIPGSLVPRSFTRTYAKIDALVVTLSGMSSVSAYTEITLEIQNDIKWVPYNTVDNALISTDGNTTVYPEEYVIKKKIVAGTVSRYPIEGPKKAVGSSLVLETGSFLEDSFFGVRLIFNEVSYTNRISTGNVFTESFDWRLTENPLALGSLIEYVIVLPDIPNAILDFENEPILDYLGNPILESL